MAASSTFPISSYWSHPGDHGSQWRFSGLRRLSVASWVAYGIEQQHGAATRPLHVSLPKSILKKCPRPSSYLPSLSLISANRAWVLELSRTNTFLNLASSQTQKGTATAATTAPAAATTIQHSQVIVWTCAPKIRKGIPRTTTTQITAPTTARTV